MAGQIKKVVVHMTPNTSKNFTEVMLEIYDKYKDTDFFDDMKKKKERKEININIYSKDGQAKEPFFKTLPMSKNAVEKG